MINLENKKELIESGYLKEVIDNTEQLFLYNYTALAQFDKDIFKKYPILLNCRGLVLDAQQNIICKSFPKFWNIEEYGVDSVLGELPAYQSFEITDKVDGSLIIVSSYNNQLVVCTRGSFTSDQANIAKMLLIKNIDFVNFVCNNTGKTFLFELIGPSNQIVVKYPEDKLIALGIINNYDGEMDYIQFHQLMTYYGFEVVKRFDGINDFKDIRNILSRDNAEGFVIKFDNGLRVKIKYEEYVRLHKLLTGISEKDILEMLRTDTPFNEFLERVPDEFNQWVQKTINNFKLQYGIIEVKAKLAYLQVKDMETRKEKALFLNQNESDVACIAFKMLDKKAFSDIIWKMIKADGTKLFKIEQ